MNLAKRIITVFGLAILVLATTQFSLVLAATFSGSTVFLPIVVRQKQSTATPVPTNTPLPTPIPTNVPSPTPTLTPTTIPTLTPTTIPTPTQTPAPSNVTVLSSSVFVPYEGSSSLYIVGEVLNNTTSNVRFVKISGTLRDTNGNVVDSDYTYSDIGILTPGMKSPFMMIFFDPPAWATYELTTTWDTTSDQLYPIEVLNSTTYFDSFDAYHVVGEIKNQYAENRSFIQAHVTMYDAAGSVIGVGNSYTNPDELTPGQTGSFDTEIFFWKGKPDRSQMASFTLQIIDD